VEEQSSKTDMMNVVSKFFTLTDGVKDFAALIVCPSSKLQLLQ